MKKKSLIIGGVVVVALIGAYVYSKNKNTGASTDSEKDTNTDASTDSETDTNTTVSTTAPTATSIPTGSSNIADVPMNTPITGVASAMTVQEILDKTEANALAKEIRDLIAKKNGYRKASSRNNIQIREIDPRIEKIVALGYKAMPDGTAVKI